MLGYRRFVRLDSYVKRSFTLGKPIKKSRVELINNSNHVNIEDSSFGLEMRQVFVDNANKRKDNFISKRNQRLSPENRKVIIMSIIC